MNVILLGLLVQMVEECHEELDVIDQVDIITGTLGKALGGASGGFTSGPKEIIDLLRQKSRPLFVFKYFSSINCRCFFGSFRYS